MSMFGFSERVNMAKQTFRSVMADRLSPDGTMVLEHHNSVHRPAWTQYNQCACSELHGRGKVNKNYFTSSKGLWYGWK